MMRVKRSLERAMLALLICVAFLSVFPPLALAQASGYWQLTEVIEQVDPDTEGLNQGAGNRTLGKHSALSDGEFYQVQTATWECSDCEIVHSNECYATATMPPERFHPGETITLYVTVQGKISDLDCHYGLDRVDASCAAMIMPTLYSPTIQFADEAGKSGVITDVQNGVAHIEKNLTAIAPEGADSKREQQLELLINYCSDGTTRLIYTWVAEGGAPVYGGTEQSQGDDATGFEEDGDGLPFPAVAAGIVVLGGGTVVIIRLVRKKPRPPQPEKNSAPEVYDWRGNRIDENARVQQTHAQYTQANRVARAEYDAQRRAEEAALWQHEAEQERMLEELIRIGQRLSTTTRDAAWKMNEIRHKQVSAAASGGALEPATFLRIKEGFGKLAGGDIIGADDIPPMPTNAQLALRAYEDAFEEVCRNETGTAVAARTVSAVFSGGASNMLYQAGKGVYRMKDYIDAGGDSAMGAVSYALFGEARDRMVNKLSDKVMWKLPFTPKGKSLPKKIMYDQRKRYVKQVVNAADKGSAGSNDKALKLIRWMFE